MSLLFISFKTYKVGGAGFEPAKAEPSDLQSDSFNHSETYPNSLYLKTELWRSMGLVRLELTTSRLKARYSTIELQTHKCGIYLIFKVLWGLVPPPTQVIYPRYGVFGKHYGHLHKWHKAIKKRVIRPSFWYLMISLSSFDVIINNAIDPCFTHITHNCNCCLGCFCKSFIYKVCKN